jgi:DUF1707 SHOCT-like domain
VSTLAANSQRERAVAVLRHHFLQGRLTAEELAERCERALAARTTADLRDALRDLPRLGDVVERARGHVGLVLTFAVIATVWTVVSFVLLLAWIAAMALGDGSQDGLLGFPLLWLLATLSAALYARAAMRRHRAKRPL